MAGLWLLFGFFLGIMVWSLWPSPIYNHTYNTDLDRIVLLNKECKAKRIFNRLSFHLVYPQYENASNVADLRINAEKAVNLNELSGSCELSFEVFLDMPHVSINPGSHLIQPLTDNTDQVFRFEMRTQTTSKDMKGSLWVYMISTQDGQEIDRVPLFIIPINIGARTFLGISLPWVRMSAMIGMVIVVVFMIITRKSG